MKRATSEAIIADIQASTPILPAHIEDTIASIARLHADHHRNATSLQRAVDQVTAFVGRPRFVGILAAVVLAWLALNLGMMATGQPPIDPPPFPWLGTIVGVVSLFIVVLLLSTQRREDELAQHREQLTLELAILSEQKTAKVIQLLEELRRDSPSIRDRVDEEADAMSQPADPHSVLEAIKETHAEAELAAIEATEAAIPE